MTRKKTTTLAAMAAAPLLAWAGTEMKTTYENAAQVPALVEKEQRMYDEIRDTREKVTEVLVLVHSALGDLKQAKEYRDELGRLRDEKEVQK